MKMQSTGLLRVDQAMESKGVVVVVDDDDRILQSLASLLESVGYEAAIFSSAEAFLESGLAAQSLCVVSDIGMPGMGGFALRQILIREHPGLPVILITGRHEFASLYNIDTGDEFHFFDKPFDSGRFIAAIDKLSKRG